MSPADLTESAWLALFARTFRRPPRTESGLFSPNRMHRITSSYFSPHISISSHKQKPTNRFTIYLHYIRLQIYSNQLQKRRFHKPFQLHDTKKKPILLPVKEYSWTCMQKDKGQHRRKRRAAQCAKPVTAFKRRRWPYIISAVVCFRHLPHPALQPRCQQRYLRCWFSLPHFGLPKPSTLP